jgi:ketosteroid isomerase-like protein
MGSANLDLVRSLYAAWERGDYSSTEWADPEIEIVMADGPSPGTWTGLGAMAEGWRDFVRAWGAWRHEADEYRELDSERVLVLSRFSGCGKRSGAEVEHKGAVLFHVVDGRVKRIVRYWDRERFLAELGLAPEVRPSS